MNTPKPEDFPLGSLESRIAMRALIEREEKAESRITLQVDLAGHGPEDCHGTWCLHEPCVLAYKSGFQADGKTVKQTLHMKTGEKNGRT